MDTHTFEKPTEDLRQVRHEEWAGDHLLVFYTVQRRFDVIESPYRYVSSEWRDLPEVRADEISTQPPSTST